MGRIDREFGRMFSLDIVDTDVFLDMPGTTQCLYFQLGMRADDDGFVDHISEIVEMVNCTQRDVDILIKMGYITIFDSGVCVIRHWNVNNQIPKSRYTPTRYRTEMSRLVENDGVYMIGD